ncbi:hypothetical protein Tco_1332477, partial [Tanacetum coccineum]
MNFMIVRSPSPYNGIIGRPGIREIQAVPSTTHGMLKFPVNGRVVTIRRIPPGPTEEEGPGSGMSQGHQGRSTEASRREVNYHDWLSNPVMVKKHDDSRIPLRLSFQVLLGRIQGLSSDTMAELDEEKMAFHTPHGVYCYTKIPFGLKNAGATYQRLV